MSKIGLPFCQRAYSIRTRIKTLPGSSHLICKMVREHIPLEQGLRHVELADESENCIESESIFH